VLVLLIWGRRSRKLVDMYISSMGTKYAYWKNERMHTMRRSILTRYSRCSQRSAISPRRSLVILYSLHHVDLVLLARVAPSTVDAMTAVTRTLDSILESGSLRQG